MVKAKCADNYVGQPNNQCETDRRQQCHVAIGEVALLKVIVCNISVVFRHIEVDETYDSRPRQSHLHSPSPDHKPSVE